MAERLVHLRRLTHEKGVQRNEANSFSGANNITDVGEFD